jgi:hypothetical protein
MPAAIRAFKPSLQMEEEEEQEQDRGGEMMMEQCVWRRMGEKRERAQRRRAERVQRRKERLKG